VTVFPEFLCVPPVDEDAVDVDEAVVVDDEAIEVEETGS
jgi:hypothetical protein